MKKLTLSIFALAAALAWAGCSKIDDYKEFTTGKIRKYAGKVDSLKLFPGKDRLVLSWLLIADPNVNKVIVKWGDADSVTVPVARTNKPDSIAHEFSPLPEGPYNFTVITTNSFGERSVPVYISGKTYGQNYTNTLLNRPLDDAYLAESGHANLKWGAPEETCIGVNITWTKNDGSKGNRYVKGATADVVLEDYKPGSAFTYQTLFKPEPLAIDTFYAASVTTVLKREWVTSKYLKNYRLPFAIGTWDGSRWGIPAHWNVSASAKTRGGGFGGFDNLNGAATFGFEKWEGETAIKNGKAWQTVTLPAGTYELALHLGNGEWWLGTRGNEPRYLAAATGNALPDYNAMNTALAYKSFVDQTRASIRFTSDGVNPVSLGFVMNWEVWDAQFFRAQEIILYKIPQ
ncbi:DUF4998 domain-containing protein [Chitinophaga caseinilytica]|uniref:DUF4998 domain-containing protein n=1 Tax=Chitinophaga caseinilytica TaxID=2267521 RepID=UPI003C2F5BDB